LFSLTRWRTFLLDTVKVFFDVKTKRQRLYRVAAALKEEKI
jgi:hypothetical protein